MRLIKPKMVMIKYDNMMQYSMMKCKYNYNAIYTYIYGRTQQLPTIAPPGVIESLGRAMVIRRPHPPRNSGLSLKDRFRVPAGLAEGSPFRNSGRS